VVLNLPNAFQWVHAVVVVFRKTSDITNINGYNTPAVMNKLRQFTADLSEPTKVNVRISGLLRYQENLVGSLALVHETKKLFPMARHSDYFQNLTLNGTTNSIYALRIGTDYSWERESGVNCSSLASAATVEITWTTALQNTNYQADMFILHSRRFGISASGFVNIAE
jgi:hypothetical protein